MRIPTLALTALLTLALAPSSARAQDLFGASLELSAAHALDDVNRARFGPGLGASLLGEIRPIPSLGVQLGGSATWLSAAESASDTHFLAALGGLRLHLGAALGWDGDVFADVHATYGTSGGRARWGGDLGLGVELPVLEMLRIGPFLRAYWSDAPQSDPIWAQLGVSVSIGALRAHEPPDGDADGIADSDDLCPELAAGPRPDPERLGCPRSDRDDDGLDDAHDLCPDVPAGHDPDPARAGCPAPPPAEPTDRDGDGIDDAHDACPDQPEVWNGVDDRDGCPDETVAPVEPIRIEIDDRVLFETNRARVRSAARPAIRAVADVLRAHPEWVRIRVEGHADVRGPEEFNEALSERRARHVVDALVEEGIARERFEIVAHGEARPRDPGEDDEAHGRNRRVEFTVVETR